MSIVLAIDTAGETAGVAVCLEGEIRAQVIEASPTRHSERLFALVDAALDTAGLERGHLTGVAVTRGPGSFTGLRVGIATAKGIAFGLGVPVVGVSSLFALARGAMPFPGLIAAVLDARKRQVYAAVYDGRSGEPVAGEGAWAPAALADAVGRASGLCLFLGSGLRPHAAVFSQALGERFLDAPASRWPIPPAQVALLACREFEEGRGLDPARLVPEYHRLSEAEEAKRSDATCREAAGKEGS